MDSKRLIRILTMKLERKYNLAHWPLYLEVERSVNEALKETDELDYLVIQLKNGVVRFSYRKTDGSVREAVGTLNPAILDLFTGSDKPKSRNQGSPDCVHYFDLERKGWRCFCPENLITVHELP